MSEENNQNVIIVQQRKTAAPIILAIIAFVLWLPSLLCNAVCAAVVSEANKGSGGGWVMLPSIMSFACFVLCFMCKSKNSAKTGGVIIALGVLIMIFNVILFNLLALISAILYIVAGGLFHFQCEEAGLTGAIPHAPVHRLAVWSCRGVPALRGHGLVGAGAAGAL